MFFKKVQEDVLKHQNIMFIYFPFGVIREAAFKFISTWTGKMTNKLST